MREVRNLLLHDAGLGAFKSRPQLKGQIMEQDIYCSTNILYALL